MIINIATQQDAGKPTSAVGANGKPAGVRQAVAVIGGGVAGAEAAGFLAGQGIETVVFEQQARPYGKIEDGLPRWHNKLRDAERAKIDDLLGRPGVHFVPNTRIGADLTLDELLTGWGFSAVLIATGAWRDRPLPIDGIDRFVGRGLVYQNPFIAWFNHQHDPRYRGPRFSIPDGAIVVGGGLASIDVAKAIQFELVQRALRVRGLDGDLVELETKGIPAVLAARGLVWEQLGLRGATLSYRRSLAEMPLTEERPGTPEQTQRVREKLLGHARTKYLFDVQPQRAPIEAIVEGDRLAGLVFARTEVRADRLVLTEDTEAVRAPLVVSAIGSVPAVLPGLPAGEVGYEIDDPATGAVRGWPNVFVLGNAVTGRGNINVSRRHSRQVAEYALGQIEDRPIPDRRQIESIVDAVLRQPAPGPQGLDHLLSQVRDRQRRVGSAGDCIQQVGQPGLRPAAYRPVRTTPVS